MNDIQDSDELEIYDPTPMMEAWRRDANEFGIPFQTQKGLMFLTAFGLRTTYLASSLEDWIGFTKKLSKKIRLKSPHIPEGQGGDFYDHDYSPLLTELAERSMGCDFTPRQIPSALGSETYAVWNREGRGNMLPDCLREGMWQMADWDEVMTSLCSQIGKGIRMNLEGAYLAGFLYFDSQWYFDKEATQQISHLVSGMMPPKFMWYRHMMNFDAKLAGQGNPMQKVLDCFLRGIPSEAPLLYRLVTFLSDQLHYEAPGKKKQRIWDASLTDFAYVVSAQRNWFLNDSVAYWADYGATPPNGTTSEKQGIPELIEYLREKEWGAPEGRPATHRDAMGVLGDQIEARWGYRIFDVTEALTPADNWTRRACILHVCVANSVLNPDWNAFE